MMDERLAPGVQDGEEAELGAEVAGVRGYGAERLGDGSEEETVDDGLVLGGDLRFSVTSTCARRRRAPW